MIKHIQWYLPHLWMTWPFSWEHRGLFWAPSHCTPRSTTGCWLSPWGRWSRPPSLPCVLWCLYVLWSTSKNSYMNFWNKAFHISSCTDSCPNTRLWKHEDRISNRFYMNTSKIWETKTIITIVPAKEMYNLIFFGELSNTWYNSLKIYLQSFLLISTSTLKL